MVKSNNNHGYTNTVEKQFVSGQREVSVEYGVDDAPFPYVLKADGATVCLSRQGLKDLIAAAADLL